MTRSLSAGQQKQVDMSKLRRAGILQIFLELGPSRTLEQARKLAFDKFGTISPHTMQMWSSKYEWSEEARKYDEAHKSDVIDRVNEILDIEKMDVGSSLDFILKKMLKAMAEGAITCRDASEAQKIAQAAEKIAKLYELIKDPESARRKYIDVHHTHEVVGSKATTSPVGIAARDAAKLLESRVRAKISAAPVPAQPVVDVPFTEVKPAQAAAPEPVQTPAQPVQTRAPNNSMPIHDLARAAAAGKKTFAQVLADRATKS